ncbi:glycerophosphoryl diester phosphodiesterase membrane domain-containing protein [Culicoidibacter larvae]|uniref:Glycerophosphoryl diester phosphodiesterase membrane domain-containing protein n=1 Tax=Culicoidibacter larvae TaxID=2579976 RepID=A0A5R8QA32_9FIRM|nr:glycerophosphoryl diester phosphodiesterase membrane domain-containing protein [Culicoidibacter larvae]TLG71512.1 hypothetical protein FEZ08_10470 [Culicoidibacter larvae]
MNPFLKQPMMSFGEYFAKSWELFKKHVKYIIASVAIFVGIGVLIGLVFGLFGIVIAMTRNPLAILPMLLLYFIVILGLFALSTLFMSGLVMQVYYPELSFGQAIKAGSKRFWPALGGIVLVGLINFGVGIVGGLLVMLSVFTIILAPFAAIGLQFAILLLNAKLAFVLPAILIDGKGPGEAIGESWNTTKDYLWQYVGRFIVLELIIGAIAVGISFIGVFLILIPALISPVLGAIFGIIFGILISFGAAILVYYMLPINIYMYGYLKDLNNQNQANQANYYANNPQQPVPPQPQQPVAPQAAAPVVPPVTPEVTREEAVNMNTNDIPKTHEDMTISPEGEPMFENDFQTEEDDPEFDADTMHDEPVYDEEK